MAAQFFSGVVVLGDRQLVHLVLHLPVAHLLLLRGVRVHGGASLSPKRKKILSFFLVTFFFFAYTLKHRSFH